MDEDRRRRAAAVEEKRKRLEELKKKKAERAQKDATGGGSGAGEAAPDASTEQFNDYVNSLLSAPTPVTAAASEPALSTAEEGGEPSGVGPADVTMSFKPTPVLTIAKGLGKVHIPPLTCEHYHKGCQTDPWPTIPDNAEGTGPEPTSPASPRSLASRRRPSRHNSLPPQDDAPPLLNSPDTTTRGGGLGVEEQAAGEEEPPNRPPLTDAEKEAVLREVDFTSFLSRSSLLVERALGREATYDVFVDYGRDAHKSTGRERGEDGIKPLVQFQAEGLSRDRAIMDVQWSPHYSELLLAAYNTQAAAGGLDSDASPWSQGGAGIGGTQGGADGLVLLWSMSMLNRPEYRFECQSPVLTARFHDHDSHLVLGGTYSGQIVVWDTRAKSLPIQRTPLSTSGHTHPVYSMTLSGAAASPTLISASSDGRVCFWNLSKLDRPESTIELAYEPPLSSPHSPTHASPPLLSSDPRRRAGGGPISISAFALNNDKGVEELVLGSESGHLYVSSLQNRKPVGLTQHEAHFGLVTSLHRHPSSSATSVQQAAFAPTRPLASLLLSASVDWSLRLWDFRRSSEALCVFQHGLYDYVTDAKWCPVHPALFSSITSGGHLYLWNLNHSLEVPVAKCGSIFTPSGASDASAPSSSGPKPALTKVAWSTEGRKLAVGDARGHLHILGVAEELIKARMDEELRLETLLDHGRTTAQTTAEAAAKEVAGDNNGGRPPPLSPTSVEAFS